MKEADKITAHPIFVSLHLQSSWYNESDTQKHIFNLLSICLSFGTISRLDPRIAIVIYRTYNRGTCKRVELAAAYKTGTISQVGNCLSWVRARIDPVQCKHEDESECAADQF